MENSLDQAKAAVERAKKFGASQIQNADKIADMYSLKKGSKGDEMDDY